MNTTPLKYSLPALVLLSTLNPQSSTCLAQGSLSPPGPPGPTMKTLTQVEPRTPISSAPFTISEPGSYYLTTNLTVPGGDAITIGVDGVTLDLNGFTISSTAASATGTGILLGASRADITIQNGHIRGGVTNFGGVYSGPGFANGIDYSNTAPRNTWVVGVSVSGCLNQAIHLASDYSTVVESCTVRMVGANGIVASTIKRSVAVECGLDALNGDQLADCYGKCTGSGSGIRARTVQNCYGSSATGYGLRASTALNCYGISGSGTGLYATTSAQNCYGRSSSTTGLYAYTAQNCYGSSSGNDGLWAERAAQNCCGYTTGNGGVGLRTSTAQNCYGENLAVTGGTGLSASEIAIGCYGYCTVGTGLSAYIANSCRGVNSAGTSQNITFKYNMP